jgi:hypothetical protein
MIKGGEEARGGGTDGGATKMSSQSRARSAAAKARLRKTSSSILNDISFGALLVDQKNSSFKDIQEQQGIQKFISLVANSSSHAKTQADVETTFATTATTTAQKSTTNSPEMEQLITMMKNHKVSEESEDRISNTNNGNKNTRSIAIPKSTKITPTNNKKKDPSESNLCNGLQIDQADPKYAYLKSRKILPLPKPRLKKSTADSSNVQIAPSPNGNDASLFKDVYNTTEQTERENSKKMRHSISPSISLSSSSNQAPHYHNILSNASSFDFSIDKLKQLPLQHQKQRQALDPITIKLDLDKSKQTVNVSAKSKENKLHKSTLSSKVASSDTKPANTGINKQPKRSPNAKKKKKGKMAVQSPPPPPPLPEQPSSRKAPNKKGQRNQQKKKWDDDFSNAPGGFLSSDITLFDNPLSDDWMCLFCQYEVLCYGLEATKRKNGYYRRKRERLQREASRRLMHHEPSDSDDELVFKDERHIRAS